MRALNDLGRAIVTANALDQLLVRLLGALGNKDIAGAAKIARRLAQRPAREEKFISERRLSVDQDNIEPMFEVQILQAVIEQKGVGFHFTDGVETAFNPIL